MCDKAVHNCLHASEFVPECYNTQKMCEKAVDTHPSTIQCVSKCYKTEEICYKAINRFFLYLILFPINTKEIVLSLHMFPIIYCPDKYKTQKMYDEAVDDFLEALGLLQVKWLKSLLLCMQVIVYSFLTTFLVTSLFCDEINIS